MTDEDKYGIPFRKRFKVNERLHVDLWDDGDIAIVDTIHLGESVVIMPPNEARQLVHVLIDATAAQVTWQVGMSENPDLYP